MTKFGIVFFLLGFITVNKCYVIHHGIVPVNLNPKSSNEVAEFYKNGLRCKRQTLGYEPRDSTDIVVLSPGNNQAYRGVPNSGTRGQTVVVSVPSSNSYGRRYIVSSNGKSQMNR